MRPAAAATASAGRSSAGVPESWARWAFQLAADIAWRRQGPRVQVLEANLRRVLGPEATGEELRALSRESMSSYARYWFEVFRLPVISAERLVAETRCVGGGPAALPPSRPGAG